MPIRWRISTKLFHGSRTGPRASLRCLPLVNFRPSRCRPIGQSWQSRYAEMTPMVRAVLPYLPRLRGARTTGPDRNGRLKMQPIKLVLISAFAIMVVFARVEMANAYYQQLDASQQVDSGGKNSAKDKGNDRAKADAAAKAKADADAKAKAGAAAKAKADADAKAKANADAKAKAKADADTNAN